MHYTVKLILRNNLELILKFGRTVDRQLLWNIKESRTC